MSHFNFVQHETLDDWHKWRDEKIGASDINYIMSTIKGFKGYKSRQKILHEKKTGIKEKGPDFIFQKGHKFEADVRPRMEMILGLNLPAMCIVPKGFPWDEYLSASLDGFDIDKNIIWECKLVGKDVFEEIKKTGLPPDKYKYQIQQQLLISKAKHCVLTFGTSIEHYDHIIVYSDDVMQNDLVNAARDFWDEWKADEKPPEGFFDVIKKIADLDEQVKELKKAVDIEKEKLKNWDFSSIYEKDNYKYSKSVSLRSVFSKDKALEFLSEDKAKKCYKESKIVSYRVSKKRKKEADA